MYDLMPPAVARWHFFQEIFAGIAKTKYKGKSKDAEGRNMNKGRNEILEFFGGLALLAVGFYLFSQKVVVYSSLFGSGRGVFGISWMPNGVIIIPFIIGVFLMFVLPDGFIGKIIAGLGLLVVIAAVVVSTSIRLNSISLFEWILYLVMIFAGLGLVLRVLFAKPKGKEKDSQEK